MTVHPYDDIEAFALGSLEPARAREVLEHADHCPTCAVMLADAMTGIAALAQLETPADVRLPAPPPAVRRNAAAALWRHNASTWFAGAAAAACIALLAWNVALRSEIPRVPIASIVSSHFVHHPLTGASGQAKVLQALDGRWVYVLADRLTPRARYALWERRNGTLIDLGDVLADAHGQATAYFEQPAGKIDAFALVTAGQSPAQDSRALRWP